jgi:hypothetical protein
VPVFAHTSPVWVDVAGRRTERSQQAVQNLTGEIDEVRHWVETAGRFNQSRRKEHLLALCAAAAARLNTPP